MFLTLAIVSMPVVLYQTVPLIVRIMSSIARFFDEKTRKLREDREKRLRETEARGRAEERGEWMACYQRMLDARAKGESFDEPLPGSARKQTFPRESSRV
jgi:hypothetical protein